MPRGYAGRRAGAGLAVGRPLVLGRVAARVALVAAQLGEQLAYFESNDQLADEFLSVGERDITKNINRADLSATTVVVQTLFAYDETIMLR